MKIAVLFISNFVLLCFPENLKAQYATIEGKIVHQGKPVAFVNVYLEDTQIGTVSDSLGFYKISGIAEGQYTLIASYVGADRFKKQIHLSAKQVLTLIIELTSLTNNSLEEVVVTGTMKPVKRLESPVPVEVFSPTFFKKNPSANVFDALSNVNGVRPKLNCNVCDTGSIQINGLDGAYTMILIDGMPVMSSLGTVYGLSGIPNALIERIEIVKGPASALYGSEAIGGIINVITKSPDSAPKFYGDLYGNSWGETNTDIGFKFPLGKKAQVLTAINYFNFQNRIDKNDDNFTDMALQNKISLFQKWNFQRKENRLFSLSARYMYEDRWGGDINWNTSFRGGDEVYAESIYTNRFAFIGIYQLPVEEKMFFNFSFVNHDQDSRYGIDSYKANQKVTFGQLTWNKNIGIHDILVGAALRYTYYDDNTPATFRASKNNPEKTWLPGIFLQDEINLSEKYSLLLGFRYDHETHHGNIYTPRLAYKWKLNENSILRLNAGTGFRVVNIFTEDHAALTGSREVVIMNDLNPERSYNLNLNYASQYFFDNGANLELNATAFYTYFTNRITANYDKNPNKIYYDNLAGFAESKGISADFTLRLNNGLNFILGGTLLNNTLTENNITKEQILTENFSGKWTISYEIQPWHLLVDYTGNIYSPMRLPLLGDLDPRPEYAPWWSIQNIQFTYDGFKRFEIYSGIKNLFDWTPAKVKHTPFIIARTNDPFDKDVVYNPEGQVVPTANNPYALTFDPEYIYAPNQGIRFFLGVRYKLF
ncbi:MAG TPA: TonB-dependent receptor [Flavobacteriaceae bacterium]|nr:TonB-dependent receptor [Flavobacteriaceae bacterium]